MNLIQNFIDGKFCNPTNSQWMPNINPATGECIGKVPDSDKSDVEKAVLAAKKAFPIWSGLSKEIRSNYLYRIADLIDKYSAELAEAESLDTGKPLSLAKGLDIPRAASNFRFFAGAALHHEDMSTVDNNGTVNLGISQPIGVIGLISPWNLPLYLLTWKIAPAICVGNTCVAKPSEFTSSTAHILCRLLNEAGLPNGVVNIIFGDGQKVGASIVESDDIYAISFTGGTVTGKKIYSIASNKIKKISLELGGKNPNIIFSDCDLQKCIDTTIRSSFANQGEICLCGSRIYVQQEIYDTFIKKFVEATAKWKVGDPFDSTTNMGALISEQHMEKVLKYIQIARDTGATIAFGGYRIKLEGKCQYGYFVSPTIITNISQDSVCVQEEIFGPVVCVLPFTTEEQVIELANDTQYGLSATVWTENLARANRMSLKLKVGTVWVNCWLQRDLRVPFGGTKMSGTGREGGKFSLDFYTEKKTICMQY